MFSSFTLFLIVCLLGTIVVAVHTHRANRREVVKNANRAFHLANEFVNRRVEAGYYETRGLKTLKKDFDDKYIELISK